MVQAALSQPGGTVPSLARGNLGCLSPARVRWLCFSPTRSNSVLSTFHTKRSGPRSRFRRSAARERERESGFQLLAHMSRSLKASLFIGQKRSRAGDGAWRAHPPLLRRLASRDIIEQFNLFWLLSFSGLVLLVLSLSKHLRTQIAMKTIMIGVRRLSFTGGGLSDANGS